MKRTLLLLVMLLFIAPTMDAQRRDGKRTKTFQKEFSVEPIVFIEGNVQFSVLPDGMLRFKHVGKKSNKKYPKHAWKNKKLQVKRNYKGQIVQVGKVPIRYKRGKIDRIGNIDFKYRRGQLKMVGDLYIVYRRGGHYLYIGAVKNRWHYYGYKGNRIS